MLALLQRVEVEPALVGHDELTVEDRRVRATLRGGFRAAREVAQQRFVVPLCRSSSSPSRNTTQRKPSHFGSYETLPAGGSSRVNFASIGSSGGCNGKVIGVALRPPRKRLDRAIERDLVPLTGPPLLPLDDPVRDTLGADDDLHRHADENHASAKLDSGAHLAVRRRGRRGPRPAGRRRWRRQSRPHPAARSVAARKHDEVDVVRRQRRRPGEPLIIVELFGHGRDDARDPECRSSP